MSAYQLLCQELAAQPRCWLITGVAGFIGSHLLETLLALGQRVTGLDDFSTGAPQNLEQVRAQVSREQWTRFAFQEGSVTDINACRAASERADHVLHQAGFVSVPLSLEDPLACHATNVTGTLNMLIAARANGVRRMVYASSSAVYGEGAPTPKVEEHTGRALSPYAASKRMAEIYAQLFFESFGFESIGLRYFNIFGPRQNPAGGYAAVIPQWIAKLLSGDECVLHGDGEISRDFCPVADVVQANLLAATRPGAAAAGAIFNVGLGAETTLQTLYATLSSAATAFTGRAARPVRLGPARSGDIRRSTADIQALRETLGFLPTRDLEPSLENAVRWYAAHPAEQIESAAFPFARFSEELPSRANRNPNPDVSS